MAPLDDDIDEAAMAEAEDALLALADEYPGYAAADVDQMDADLALLQATGGQDADRIAAIHGVAHNIKGQGSAFGYELMTGIGEAICHLVRGRVTLDGPEMARLAMMIAACRTVLTERLVGHGGAFGARLSANLGLALKAA